MTGSLQEPADAGEVTGAPAMDVASELTAAPPALQLTTRKWLAAWLVMFCVAAIASSAMVLAAGGKKGFFLAELATMICMVAGFTDSRTGRIPNWLTYPAILLGLALNGITPLLQALHAGTLVTWLGSSGAMMSLAGFGVCVGVGLVGALVGGVHGGDLKLMAGLGALLGLVGIVDVMTISIGLALLYSVINLLLQGRLVMALRLATQRMMEWHILRQFRTPLPDAEPYSAMYFPMALPLAVGMTLWQYWRWHSGEALL